MKAGILDSEESYGGLSQCFSGAEFDSFCTLKTIEFLITVLLLIVCSVELYMQVRFYGCRLRWQQPTIALIICSLLFNILYCIWNNSYELYSLLTYANSLYFVAIVGYVCHKYIEKKKYGKHMRWTLMACIIAMGVFHTFVLVNSILKKNQPEGALNMCQQSGYLYINGACLGMCIAGLGVLWVNQREENKKVAEFNYEPHQLYSPMKGLWIWMGTNTVAQIVNIIEEVLLLNSTSSDNCMIVPRNVLLNGVLMLAFMAISLISGYVATIWYFLKTRKRDDRSHHKQLIRSIQERQFSEEIYTVNFELLIPEEKI